MRRVLASSLLPLLPLALAACGQEQIIQEQNPRFVVSPTTFLDLGVVPLGGTATGEIAVDHVHGPDGRILTVELAGDDADHFGVGVAMPLKVDRAARAVVPITFTATEPGYYWASVTLTHNGEGPAFQLDVRAAALSPDVVVSPRFLDFGPVPDGSAASRQVTVSNLGETPFDLTEAFFSEGAFSTGLAFPATVAPGREVRVPVTYASNRDQAIDATLELYVGDVVLPVVQLRANDCERGLPDAYDDDGDGVTSCGGDCNDSRDDVRPGLAELPDGEDQDCDGIVDEGTTNFDDDGDGWTEFRGDCNDGDRDVSPDGTEEIGNGIDDDCDGVVDIGGADGDGDGYSTGGGDCDDGDASAYPGAPELPDGDDDDCDGSIDEGTTATDDDGDGYCESLAVCRGGATPGDCDDTAPGTKPGGTELADGRDNDCDGVIDDGTANRDDDGDGYSELGGDCDDGDASVSPMGGC